MLFGNIYLHEKVFSRNPIIYLTSLSNYNIFRSWVISTPLKLLYVWKNLVQLIKKIHFTSEKEIWQNLKNEIGRHPRLFRISSTSSRLCSISNKKNEKNVYNKIVHQIDCFCCCFIFEELGFWKLRYRFSTLMEEDDRGFLEAAPLLRLQPFQCHHQSHHYNIIINLSDIVNIWLTLTKMMTEHVFQVWRIS